MHTLKYARTTTDDKVLCYVEVRGRRTSTMLLVPEVEPDADSRIDM